MIYPSETTYLGPTLLLGGIYTLGRTDGNMTRYFSAYYNAGSGLYEAINGYNNDKSINAISGADANGQAALISGKSGKFISFPVDGVAAAYITTACPNLNSNIIYTAKTVGPNATSIRIRYVVAGNNTALSVAVSGNDITVNVATNAGGTPTSTAAQVKTAIDASSPAQVLIGAVLAGDGTGVVAAFGYTNLTDGSPKASYTADLTLANADITFTAQAQGPNANSIRVRIVVAGNNTALSIGTSGTDITINSATSAGGAATTTASQAIAALNADSAASALVIGSLPVGQDGTGVVNAFSYTNLSGGIYGGVTATNVTVAPASGLSATTF